VQETVSDEARGDQWGVRSIDRKVRLVIFRGDQIGGRARVAIDEERVL